MLSSWCLFYKGKLKNWRCVLFALIIALPPVWVQGWYFDAGLRRAFMIKFTLNGEATEYDGDPQMPVLWFVRDVSNLTGSKFGCGRGLCGACTMHLNGQPIRACSMPMSLVDQGELTTIEGVESKAAKAVQAAWQQLDVVQCGYCQSGQIMSAISLLEKNAKPTDNDIDKAMAGNVCRCATYQRIRAAIHVAAKAMS